MIDEAGKRILERIDAHRAQIIAFAEDIVTMYCFYEILTLVTLPLILHTLSREAILAGRTYLYYSLGGAAFAFIGMFFILNYHLFNASLSLSLASIQRSP